MSKTIWCLKRHKGFNPFNNGYDLFVTSVVVLTVIAFGVINQRYAANEELLVSSWFLTPAVVAWATAQVVNRTSYVPVRS